MKPRIKKMKLQYWDPLGKRFTREGYGLAVRWSCAGAGKVGYGPTANAAYWHWRTEGLDWRAHAH